MLKAQILQVDTKTDKLGEVKYDMTVLSNFSSYGVVRPATVQVKLNADSYAKYKEHVGKQLELDVVIPLPDYPLHLK